MASTLVKLVASNLLRARPVASSSRFFSTKAFQYVQHDSADECILKRDEEPFTIAQAAIIHAFSPHVSPAGNLARLLNMFDELIEFLHWHTKFRRWNVVEDDKALYILRNITGSDNVSAIYENDVKESVPKSEFMSGIHENDVKESVPKSDLMSGIHEKDVKECVSNKETVRLRDLRPFIELMRGVKSEPCEYYYVMQGGEEIDSFAKSILERGTTGVRVSANLRVCSVLQNPKAVYVIVGGDTSDVYGGYVYELFLDDSLYNIKDAEMEFCQGELTLLPKKDAEMDHTSETWRLIIPKKRGERTQIISGNLIFFREGKIFKPTHW